MKRALSLALAVLMTAAALLCFAGCSKETDALIGTWEGDVNYAPLFNQMIQSVAGEGLAEYWTVEEFRLTLVMTFRDDGTYSMTVDQNKLDTAIEQLKFKLSNGLRYFVQDLIDASSSTQTVDEFMAEKGIAPDALIDQALGQEIRDQMVADCTFDGNYKAEDGKLYTSAGLEFSIDEGMYEIYEITQNTLTLMSVVNNGGASFLNEAFYPITLIRIQ
ncbi:MAG: hypothetical protein E7439_03290 [Ruminococcaceae bacterium]|nr:hypothetical protein [Oscillospiraceae bacterium]